MLAQAERFELSHGITRLSVFKTDPFNRLGMPASNERHYEISLIDFLFIPY